MTCYYVWVLSRYTCKIKDAIWSLAKILLLYNNECDKINSYLNSLKPIYDHALQLLPAWSCVNFV